MNAVIGDILPFAIAVTISPVPIIAEILLLFTKRPVPNAAMYLTGFALGVAGVLAAFIAIAGSMDLTADSGPSRTVSIVKLVLGALLLVAAVRQFRGRPAPGEAAPMPKWMDGIADFSPGKSLVIGATIGAVNPKNIAVGLGAAAAIAAASLSTGKEVTAAALYVVVAALGVAAPLVVMVALGRKAQPVLDGWKEWLGQNNAAVMAVLFVVFGVVLIGKGIAGL